METTEKIYSLSYKEAKTYLLALLFIAGNIILPQLCHLAPGGGQAWLPIYFFTLIASYKYGLRVGLLTAVLSPLLNNALFGMPPANALSAIAVKSSILAVAAAYMAYKAKGISFWAVLVAVAVYQVAGTLIEWEIVNDFHTALQDFRIGIPGILLQIFGGYLALKAIAKL
ncbi:MAG: ECF transporter S component [Prevotella sp.]|jgi:hypothetical protein|nr:ECF transporter S component [Prevotella sp.]